MQKERVALTFDDGPNPEATPQILQILKGYSAKATFFVCGANIQRHPELLKQVAEQGHLVGNHTFTHPRIKTVLGFVWDEITRTQELINGITGQDQKIFRPPYGISPPWLNKKLEREDWKSFLFDIDPQDWRTKITVAEIVRKTTEYPKNGDIILLHDGHNVDKNPDRSQTVEALPQIIEALSGRDFKFVNVLEI